MCGNVTNSEEQKKKSSPISTIPAFGLKRPKDPRRGQSAEYLRCGRYAAGQLSEVSQKSVWRKRCLPLTGHPGRVPAMEQSESPNGIEGSPPPPRWLKRVEEFSPPRRG